MNLFKTKLIALLKEFGIVAKDEEMISYEVIFEADVKDAHNQWMSKETLEKGCEDFNKYLKEGVVKSNLFHLQDTESFTIMDTWIQKEFDVTVDGTDQPIKAGTWVAKLQYNDESLWQLKKAGVVGGVSIGCKGNVNEETGEITNLDFSGIDV